MNIILNNGDVVATGCHLDSHHGQYIIDGMADLIDALTSSNRNPTKYVALVRAARLDDDATGNDPWDWCDEIEDKLNDMLPDDCGAYWGHVDGDFGLWGNYEDEDGPYPSVEDGETFTNNNRSAQ